jgi:hypothetical protein
MKDTYTFYFILGGTCIVIISIIAVFYFISPNDTINNQRTKKGYLDLLSSISMILVPLAAVFIFIGVKRRETQEYNKNAIKGIFAAKKKKRIVKEEEEEEEED